MDVCDEIVLHLRARVPLLVLVTGEEERALGLLDRARAARDPAAEMFVWDAGGGLRGQDGRRVGDLRTVEAALERITELVARDPQRRDLYVLCDVQAYWDRSPAVRRRLRNLARAATSTRSSVVVLVPTGDIPPDLAGEVAVVTLPLPGTDDAAEILRTMSAYQVRRLPVIDGRELVGIVALADVARALPDRPVGDLLQAISID